MFIVTFIAMDLVQLGFNPHVPGATFFGLAVSIALGALTYSFPIPASIVLILFNCVGEYIMRPYGQFTLFFFMMAATVIAYETTNRWAALTFFALIAYTAMEHVLMPDAMPISSVISYIIFFLLCILLGSFLRWNQERTALLRAALHDQAELRILRNNHLLAAQLHDTLSQDLAAMSLLAQSEAMTDPDNEAWHRMERYSTKTAADMRLLIRQLRDETAEGQGNPSTFASALHGEIHESEQLLADSGFSGTTDVHLDPDEVETGSTVLLALHEVYTNIYKHASQTAPYHVIVQTTDDGMVRIDSTNGTRPTEGAVVPGDNGLASLQTVLRDIGGDCDWSQDGERWHLEVSIPATREMTLVR
ncbi:sensor histidine kinase [Bifidobacterium cuniculi]|uniref:sensor histidine kinase n=1 Tax=Bifidobacterium cuniculi TaxID=1688 RepID=UPI00068B5C20|nr:hypothetical protein [Bifidobacterium cuniculi]